MNIVSSNEPSVYLGLDKLTKLERNAIVRPKNPPPGLAGFLFDIPVEDMVELESEASDHFVEDSTAVQDHVVLKPEIVSVRGFVGELVQTQSEIDTIAEQQETLALNEDLEPEYTTIQTLEFENDDRQEFEEIVAETESNSLHSYFNARSNLTTGKQSKAFAYFYELWKGRQLMTVETPWGFFTDMIIQKLRVSQDETSKMASDFSVVFKKMRFAGEIAISSGQIAGRAALQTSEKTNNGVAGKESVSIPKNKSWLVQLTQ